MLAFLLKVDFNLWQHDVKKLNFKLIKKCKKIPKILQNISTTNKICIDTNLSSELTISLHIYIFLTLHICLVILKQQTSLAPKIE